MPKIAYIDLEIDPNRHTIHDIGAIYNNQQLHTANISLLDPILADAEYICGHHFLQHDYTYLQKQLNYHQKNQGDIIDTLLLSPLLFPARPYHALDKDYKIEREQANHPLDDCLITQALLESEIAAFFRLPETMQTIFYQLLGNTDGFSAFFRAISFRADCDDVIEWIRQTFASHICEHSPLADLVKHHATALAYALALIHCQHRYSITPTWLLHQYPEIETILLQLCGTPCTPMCDYCRKHLDASAGLRRYFGFPNFRQYNQQPLQQRAAEAAIAQHSLLAIFPTGGGKSVTFQVPALIAGERHKALTVIISPLQSLMKDQVDNLEQRGITEAVTLNGSLDPIERQKAVERVQDGSASLLYIAPESLRSRTIERLLLSRNIARFVIDEAHCFSAWGQDFRVDYLYIGEFIRRIQEQKQLSHRIPVSCFTATAKPQVVHDICQYFKRELDWDLAIFAAKVGRSNLHYTVLPQANDEQKYQTLRHLIESHQCPTIVYVSRVKRTEAISQHLQRDGLSALPYHGKMDNDVKAANQNAFKNNEAQIMVATSAFGMGVDKSDVGLVVHYDVSDSLENYVQEAGRAGRDEQIQAACYILYNAAEDLDKHFIFLNQNKISQQEIQQIWKAIKDLCGARHHVTDSALAIARRAGWRDEHIDEIETRVKTAIAALEDVGYVKRGQNMPRVFATSILSKNAAEAIEKIEQSHIIYADDKPNAVRIIKKLFSQKSQAYATDEEGESRVDYLADVLGMKTEKVVRIVTCLREEGILEDQQDLQAFIRNSGRTNHLIANLNKCLNIERALLAVWVEGMACQNIKQLSQAVQTHFQAANPKQIKSLLYFWKLKNWLGRVHEDDDEGHETEIVGLVLKQSADTVRQWIERKAELAQFILRHLYELSQQKQDNRQDDADTEKWIAVDFSVGALKQAFHASQIAEPAQLDEIEDALFYLSRMELLKIEGGFLVIHQRLRVERLLLDNRKQYTKEDYKKLAQYYETRKQQIHIIGKYAQMMLNDVQAAQHLVEDYFSLDYAQFLNHYFADESELLNRNMTAARFEKWFNSLSPAQLPIIQDNSSQYIVVFAAPGSGKTRVLVHKLASLYQMEEVKHEQLLMLTFSRAAAHEFKSRLFDIMGNAAAYVEIKTFHSYCFDLLGRVGDLSQSDDIIQQAIDKINAGEVEENRIAKLVLVVDEAQDINDKQFALVKTLMAHNEHMRVIAVGDDDQTIYTFNGASPHYMYELLTDFKATKYELSENHRSKRHIVQFCNDFARHLQMRLKEYDVVAVQPETGEVDYISFSGSVLPLLLERAHAAMQTHDSVAILTQTNEEAQKLVGQLRQANIPAKLVQSNEGFKVGDWLEVRIVQHYLNIQSEQTLIQPEQWEQAKIKARDYLQRSVHLPLLNNLLECFEQAHPERKYVSDWLIFIQESKLEDFYRAGNQLLTVSTIHKAKGREYDHVFVLLDKNKGFKSIHDDEKKRECYVAFSRAKSHLSILCNDDDVRRLCDSECVHFEDYQGVDSDNEPRLALYLGLKDVYLSHFYRLQAAAKRVQSGDALGVNENSCWNAQGEEVLKFSHSFKNQLHQYLAKGYRLVSAEVNFVVVWHSQDRTDEVRVILPIIYLQR